MSTEINRPLSGVRVIEASSFVTAPSAGMTLSQLGAEVIRVDPPGGASDINRWPLTADGASLFWAGLNKGKRSVTLDYRTPQGHELLVALATAPGPGSGILLDNLVGKARPTYDELVARRADPIHVRIGGKANGAPAVDYTVNAEYGVPQMTGPQDSEAPVNHVLPAWDLLTGMTAVSSLLAALHRRDLTGEGSQIDIALADVALAGVGSMGWLAEADLRGRPRERQGNHMYGAFGVDFSSADGRRVMVVALTEGQWKALVRVTETEKVFAALETVLGANLQDESDRYELRETIAAILRPWFAQRPFDVLSKLLDQARVLWSPYIDMAQAAGRARYDSPLAVDINQPGIGPMLATGSPVRWSNEVQGPVPAPRLGEDTEDVLSDVLGLDDAEIGKLYDDGVLGDPAHQKA